MVGGENDEGSSSADAGPSDGDRGDPEWSEDEYESSSPIFVGRSFEEEKLRLYDQGACSAEKAAVEAFGREQEALERGSNTKNDPTDSSKEATYLGLGESNSELEDEAPSKSVALEESKLEEALFEEEGTTPLGEPPAFLPRLSGIGFDAVLPALQQISERDPLLDEDLLRTILTTSENANSENAYSDFRFDVVAKAKHKAFARQTYSGRPHPEKPVAEVSIAAGEGPLRHPATTETEPSPTRSPTRPPKTTLRIPVSACSSDLLYQRLVDNVLFTPTFARMVAGYDRNPFAEIRFDGAATFDVDILTPGMVMYRQFMVGTSTFWGDVSAVYGRHVDHIVASG